MSELDLNNQEICIICNEIDLEDNHLFKKTKCNCNILFHENCYKEYLLSCNTEEDMKCPVCRTQIELTVSDIRDLDEDYYNRLNYVKCIFTIESFFFWSTFVLINYSMSAYIILNDTFYFNTNNGLNNWLMTQLLFVNTILNIEFLSLVNCYRTVKRNMVRQQNNYYLLCFLIYYVLYLFSFGIFSYFISNIRNNLEHSPWLFIPIIYSLIKGFGNCLEEEDNYFYSLITSHITKKDAVFILMLFISPYLCIFVDESKVSKDDNFYNKLVSLMILTGFFTLLYANTILSRTNKSVFYVSYTCIQLMAFGIFSSGKDVNHLFFYYDSVILFFYIVYLLVILFILPMILYIIINIDIRR